MALKHSNPTLLREDADKKQFWARAPYNFVPLPEKMVPAREALLDQDIYHENGLTGWIDCELETCSPTYIRCMLTDDEHKKQGNKKPDELTDDDKKERARFFGYKTVKNRLQPVIPGSSLRGMIRSLVEIVSHGRMNWVGKEPTFTFRAVAAKSDDPLRDPYQNILGRNGSNVQTGYLHYDRKAGEWYVQPALTPNEMGWRERTTYLKIKERWIGGKDIPGYVRFNSPDYHPQLHRVSFEVDSKRGRPPVVSQIGSREDYTHQGVLVCSGNMLETDTANQESPRKSHALVLAPNEKKQRLRIRPEAVRDYKAGLTPFQQEELKAWGDGPGCLPDPKDLDPSEENTAIFYTMKDGINLGPPVFYVVDRNEVVYFGHSPNFRIPARLFGKQDAATPLDFVPEILRANPSPDLADAIFGWVEDGKEKKGLSGQRAGRVFFSDAQLVGNGDDIWYKSAPIIPHVLASPKPTTFQHYLVQDHNAGHDPDDKRALAHYGTSPDETQIRGHKRYWHKGSTLDLEATTKERDHPKQLTLIMPLKTGVRFSFRIYFENLYEEELGALCWSLMLPDESGQIYRHKLGMGKPLGMGAVAIIPRLFLTQRGERYTQLFKDDDWNEAATETEPKPYLSAFERFVLKSLSSDKNRLAEIERIQMLLALHQWRESDPAWLEQTRYMEIQHGPDELNEYKERPVLPDALAVAEGKQANLKPPSRVTPPQRPAATARHSVTTAEQHGIVVEFGLGKNQSFGYIQPDGSNSTIFVHRKQLTRGLQTLKPKQRVVFKIGKGMKGPEAQDVRLEE